MHDMENIKTIKKDCWDSQYVMSVGVASKYEHELSSKEGNGVRYTVRTKMIF